MGAAALLDDGDRLADFALRFEVPHEDDRVGQVACIHGRDHRSADQSLMRADENRGDVRLAEVRQELVQLDDQKALFGHGVEIAVQAVDDHDGYALVLHGPADGVCKLAWRKLGGVHLLHCDAPRVDV